MNWPLGSALCQSSVIPKRTVIKEWGVGKILTGIQTRQKLDVYIVQRRMEKELARGGSKVKRRV